MSQDRQKEKQHEPWREGRRSQRIVASLPVQVYGTTENGDPFLEEARTVTINAHGALVMMSSPVKVRQKLVAINPSTEEEMPCRVAFVGKKDGNKTEVGIEFDEPSGKFWHISFPPVDWRPRTRN